MLAQNIRQFAAQLPTATQAIARAVTFDPQHLEAVWDIPVSWNFRLRNSAGRANRRGIWLHPGLQSAPLAEIENTFLHETAHVMEGLIYGTSGHGQTWWEAMIRLGQRPWDRTHRYHDIEMCKAAASTTGTARRLAATLEELDL